MTISREPDQTPVTGVSLISLVRRGTSALLSQLFKKTPVVTMESPGLREKRVTPLYRRRRSIPSYLGIRKTPDVCLAGYYNLVCQDLEQLRHHEVVLQPYSVTVTKTTRRPPTTLLLESLPGCSGH